MIEATKMGRKNGMIVVLYGLIVFAACMIGSTVGIGGGVIIKPLLDAIGYHTVEVVGFVSSCSVFAMSISSSLKHIRSKTPVSPKIVLLVALGSLGGGVIGRKIFDTLFERVDQGMLKGIQAVIIAAFVVFVIIYVNTKNAKKFRIKNPVAMILTGMMLGFLSAFLGIGGGLINTTFLVMLFSFNVKESAVYSVAIIFFSQLSQLTTVFLDNRFEPYTPYAPYILVAMAAGVIGGLVGSKLNKKFSNKVITRIFSVTLVFVALVNVYNAVLGFTS